MSHPHPELPIGPDGAVVNHPIKITDELPRFIGAPLNWISIAMMGIVIFSGFLMACTFGAVVVIRYGFGGDLFAYEEWLLAISIVGFFAGAVVASERQAHIRADVLGSAITNSTAIWWRNFVVLVIELFVTLFIVYACYISIAEDFSFPRLRSTPVLGIPFVSWRIAIMIGFTLMAVFTAAYLYVHIRKGLGLPLKSNSAKESKK
ncbi:TRAP transporter small permease [Roseinatronobacter monicus]|uniref:TRAP transporter small permease protein n=1 Tax=Roseinatronobacter monicus TaxID=393481 RepID=A0A543K5S6_9RHOB|nr:TRAP transporter small permease [Roseinatronobacter monicus]TQM90412.1 TRAP-type C4-dicarboxylate transport system permease small subunit [Roseinatronobacter monicus]